jgi:hypothetical protein
MVLEFTSKTLTGVFKMFSVGCSTQILKDRVVDLAIHGLEEARKRTGHIFISHFDR